jgi:SAM-dependent methyltransferase|tara:strand:- start:24462 stop:25499 length:1038 start_codon:yes stop_codon:yes gene_type:complete
LVIFFDFISKFEPSQYIKNRVKTIKLDFSENTSSIDNDDDNSFILNNSNRRLNLTTDLYTSDQCTIIDSIDRSIGNLEQVHALSNKDYAQCLEVFEANSDQRFRILDWLEENILTHMLKSSNSILSVGCGAGAFDEHVLKYLNGRMEQVKYLGIEPNPLEATEFLKRMQAQSVGQMAVDTSVLVEKFGERSLDAAFDLILFVHSIYYLDDRNEAIDAALSALKPGGVLIIVVAPDESLNVIANLIWQRQMGQKSFFSDDLRRHFDARGIDYSETRIAANLDATAGFNSTSQEGRDIIDFTVQTRMALLPEPLQHDISEFLLSTSKIEDGNTYLPHPVDVFCCRKG